MEQLDKSIFQGRLIHILPARRPPPPPETEKYADSSYFLRWLTHTIVVHSVLECF